MDVTIRAKTITKYYYRMNRKAKGITANNGISPKGKKFSARNLYEKYSTRGKRNFLSYVARAKATFTEPSIERDTKRHKQKIRKAINRSKVVTK